MSQWMDGRSLSLPFKYNERPSEMVLLPARGSSQGTGPFGRWLGRTWRQWTQEGQHEAASGLTPRLPAGAVAGVGLPGSKRGRSTALLPAHAWGSQHNPGVQAAGNRGDQGCDSQVQPAADRVLMGRPSTAEAAGNGPPPRSEDSELLGGGGSGLIPPRAGAVPQLHPLGAH